MQISSSRKPARSYTLLGYYVGLVWLKITFLKLSKYSKTCIRICCLCMAGYSGSPIYPMQSREFKARLRGRKLLKPGSYNSSRCTYFILDFTQYAPHLILLILRRIHNTENEISTVALNRSFTVVEKAALAHQSLPADFSHTNPSNFEQYLQMKMNCISLAIHLQSYASRV